MVMLNLFNYLLIICFNVRKARFQHFLTKHFITQRENLKLVQGIVFAKTTHNFSLRTMDYKFNVITTKKYGPFAPAFFFNP